MSQCAAHYFHRCRADTPALIKARGTFSLAHSFCLTPTAPPPPTGRLSFVPGIRPWSILKQDAAGYGLGFITTSVTAIDIYLNKCSSFIDLSAHSAKFILILFNCFLLEVSEPVIWRRASGSRCLLLTIECLSRVQWQAYFCCHSSRVPYFSVHNARIIHDFTPPNGRRGQQRRQQRQ